MSMKTEKPSQIIKTMALAMMDENNKHNFEIKKLFREDLLEKPTTEMWVQAILNYLDNIY